ncbi:membrane-targeted effector domain-containing toxin [Pseudomonas orientalis]|uniref:C-terminal region of Pasteurella multocida toxin residues 569-1285 n=1 Tax=Pseudomonas orientalis TaxID=76758 RepID=A0A8B3Y3Q9_9PSED|nr:membrane-targeted effector domain-containing toxin [Pseudomonas orientalis]SDU33412.1 C-terminal region of Pasteurella multocida toxin residues 569-1285 [Pseudomonas orientalis]
MSTSNLPPASPTHQELHTHLLEIAPSLRSQTRRPVVLPPELLALEKLNTTLSIANEQFLNQARKLFEALEEADLTQEAGKTLLATLKADLNNQLQTLDETSTVDGQGRKSYLISTVGAHALEQQAKLDVRDYLLSPAEQLMVENCARGPSFRPGMYALNFSYRDNTVTFAGAFVLTRKSSPGVDSLTSGEDLGQVVLFTPSRGLETFDSLAQLDQRLKATLALPAGHKEFCRHLPAHYQALDVVDIWPLQLQRIEGEPLFEHTYNAIIDKRRQDIALALSLVENPLHDAMLLKSALENAVKAALPDLSLRLAFRRQRLLERSLYNGLPDWYRSAASTDQETLSRCIQHYNQARTTFIELLGPAASPQALANFQLVEYLDEELEIHTLDPRHLQITTRRNVTHVGIYEQTRNLVDLSYTGLHTGDELPGSDFLTQTTLTYAGAALQGEHADLDAQSLLDLLREPGLQSRLEFAARLKERGAEPEFKRAARDLFDQRLILLAFTARLRGDLSQADHTLFEALRAGTNPRLCARTVLLHGAQLKDLWLLREEDPAGQTRRLLLCTPDSPRERQFLAFSTERECQAHIIAWADDKTRFKGLTMSDYLLEQCPLRFRPKMGTFLAGLSLRPDAGEHAEVTFGPLCSHTVCLDAMVVHSHSTAQDDYEYSTPLWYRQASATDRARLTSLAEDAQGALRTYNAAPDSEANFVAFNTYLHDKAKLSLNTLLGRSQNDIDPDTVYVSAPWPLLGGKPQPLSYTRLYRDGYTDNVGFIDAKFSTSATFSGPEGVDLSRLTPQNVSRSVSGVWIGQRYTDEVRAKLQSASSPGYAKRRDATLAITQLQMKYAALDCCLRGHITRADLTWLERAIDSLGDTAVTTRNAYWVHRLTIDGDWVMGTYLFSHADNPVLLYTPNAPDGIDFREAKLFNYWLKKVDGVSDYLNGRVAIQSRTRIGSFLKTARGGLPETIDRTTPSPARYDPTIPATTLIDLRSDLYDMVLQRKIDDVTATTVNRTDMIMGILWTCVELVTAIATIPFPALSLGLGSLLAFKDAMLAINAYQQGDTVAALQHYIGYLANLGGAVLFDLRPALTGTLNALPIRPATKVARQATLLNEVDPGLAAAMKPVLFDGSQYWVRDTPDALGRYLLFRHDPLSGHMQSTARLVNQDTEGRWIRSGVAGGMFRRRSYQVLQEEIEQPLARYEMTPEQGPNFRAALDPERARSLASSPDDPIRESTQDWLRLEFRELGTSYANKVKQLTEDADAFFTSPPARPPRAPLPVLAADSSPSTVLATLFPLKQGLIIGAANASVASKQLLIENMPALVSKGLKRLYIENLPADVFRNKLRIINRQEKGDLKYALQRIRAHLARVDTSLGWQPDAPFTYSKLMQVAHEHNVAIEGVDASSSYFMEHVLELSSQERFIPRNANIRNFYSHKALAAKAPDEGWIALVDHNRIGTADEVPGLAALQDVVALRVEDVAAGQAVGVLPDTSSAALSRGDYRLTMVTASQTLPRASTSGVVPLPPPPSHYTKFDLPASFRATLDDMVRTPSTLDTSSHFIQSGPYREAFVAFKATRERLDTAAKAAFANYTPPVRPSFTGLAAAASEEAFIKQAYKLKRGLIIGEAHADQSSKRLLINHMKLLKQQGVRTLYLEHLLTDLHQLDLETFQTTLFMPHNLNRYLARQTLKHMGRDYSGTDSYTYVIKAANKAGIRVRALDCTASYHVRGMRDINARTTLFNYFANEVINADQAARGAHKWVALMGESHAHMYQGVPGVAQLQDAVSLRVRDVAPSSARPPHPGTWEFVEGGAGSPGTRPLRSDFYLDVGIAGKPAPQATPQPDRAWLRNVDDFLIEQPSATEANVLHRADSGAIMSTPIQIDDRGQLFVGRWPQLNDKRFLTLEQLQSGLKEHLYFSNASAATLPVAQLRRTGEFLIERPSANRANLLHRSATGEILTCPIHKDNVEQFYIEQFPALADRRFLLMEDLIEAITTERNMSAVPIRTSPRSRLRERGDFLIERSSGVQMNLLHRARTGDIVSTPIRMGEQGQLFIDRWDELKAKPFSNVGILIFALKRVKGMSPAF